MARKKKNAPPVVHKYEYSGVMITLFLCVATILIYQQVHQCDFIDYDDTDYVSQNPNVQQGITIDSVLWAFSTVHASNWHPVTWMSHMADCQIFGLDPGAHHMVSLFFHIVNSLLLFYLFKNKTKMFWQSAFMAALFALHPLHVESVAWVAERKDVLSTFFFLLTLWNYFAYTEKKTTNRYILVLVCFSFGLMSKPMLVTLPFVLLLADIWPLSRFQLRSSKEQMISLAGLIWEKIPLFLLAAISCCITFYAQSHGGAIRSLENISFSSRVANALISYVGYIGKMICPANLAFFYPYPAALPWWKVVGALVILASISFLVIRMMGKRPYLAVGWFWYLGTLVPVIGLVQVGNQAMADRYTYIPLIGLFIIIAWGAPDLLAKFRHRKSGLAGMAGLVLLALSILSWNQAGYWKDSITLFEHAINVTSENYLAHFNLANTLAKQGQLDLAISHYNQTLSINPDFAEAHANLGNVYSIRKKTQEAIEHYLLALKLNPEDAGVHYNLGITFNKIGKIDEAIRHYSEAIHIKPDYEEAYFKLGVALFQKGNIDGAIYNFKEVLRINPDNADAKNNLNSLLMLKQRN